MKPIVWSNLERTAALSDAELDHLHDDLGIGGFVLAGRRLFEQDFTGDPAAVGTAGGWADQRTLRDSRIAERCTARGMKCYLGVKITTYTNLQTPVVEWFADWTAALERFRNVAAAAKLYGFAGVALDQEMYAQKGGVTTATWHWDYPGNTRSEDEVRVQVWARGLQTAVALAAGYPDLELVAYYWDYPGSWWDRITKRTNPDDTGNARDTFVDWFRGVAAADNVAALRLYNSVFYKDDQIPDGYTPLDHDQDQDVDWDDAMRHDAEGIAALGLGDHVTTTPFIWPTEGVKTVDWVDRGGRYHYENGVLKVTAKPLTGKPGVPFDHERPVEHVAEQALASAKHAQGGEYALYNQLGMDALDKHAAGLLASSQVVPPPPDPVDPTPYSAEDLERARVVAKLEGIADGKVLGFEEARRQVLDFAHDTMIPPEEEA